MPGGRDVAVKQSMDGALQSAAGTVVARQRTQHATWRPSRRRRIDRCIKYDGSNHRYHCDDCCRQTFLWLIRYGHCFTGKLPPTV